MNIKTDIKSILDFIHRNNYFLLVSHMNADGDAISSSLAFSMMLEQLEKKYYLMVPDREANYRLNYLANFDKIAGFVNPVPFPYKYMVTFDVPSTERLGEISKLMPSRDRILKIDHHPDRDRFADFEWVRPEASASAEMVYELLVAAQIKMDKEIATQIYTGLVYDTGRFAHSNTTSKVLEIAAQMVAFGAEPQEVTRKLFYDNAYETYKFLSKAFENLELFYDGKVGVITVDHEIFRMVPEEEMEGVVDHIISIRGVDVALFIREFEPNQCKISLRSKNNVDVREIAQKFGGGGHVKASGCRIQGNPEEAARMMVQAFKPHYSL